jgi:hypothetical protein
LQLIEVQLDNLKESSKVKKKVYNILVECLQNLFHHIDEIAPQQIENMRSAIFMLKKNESEFTIMTGNYIKNENVFVFKKRLEDIQSLTIKELKDYYKSILNNGQMSIKGGGGLGIIDIAIKSGGKFLFDFSIVDSKYSFFSFTTNIVI